MSKDQNNSHYQLLYRFEQARQSFPQFYRRFLQTLWKKMVRLVNTSLDISNISFTQSPFQVKLLIHFRMIDEFRILARYQNLYHFLYHQRLGMNHLNRRSYWRPIYIKASIHSESTIRRMPLGIFLSFWFFFLHRDNHQLCRFHHLSLKNWNYIMLRWSFQLPQSIQSKYYNVRYSNIERVHRSGILDHPKCKRKGLGTRFDVRIGDSVN